MQSNQELDAWLAENVMGHLVEHFPDKKCWADRTSGKWIGEGIIPDYRWSPTEHISAAMEVKQKLMEDGWAVSTTCTLCKAGLVCQVNLDRKGSHIEIITQGYHAEQLAICKAAVEAWKQHKT